MDNTKKSSDSLRRESCSLSSPSLQSNNSPVLGTCRKRKASCIDNFKRNVSEVVGGSPQFSSTFNESVVNHIDKIYLEHGQEKVFSHTACSSNNSFNQRENRKFYSVPNTPEHLVKRDFKIKRSNTSSVIKNLSQLGMQSQSPLNKEAYEIIYPELPSLEGIKKPLTPLKVDKGGIQAKKRLFRTQVQNPLEKILSNRLIMNKILKHLSSGDLYRLAKVSERFKESILDDKESKSRYKIYTTFYPHHKENYRITPPSSPEKDDEMNVEPSPGSKNFVHFFEIAKDLNKNQSLMKCPQCQKASIVENNIAQCQDIYRCGYIFCKKCDSFSKTPSDFIDKCNNAKLLNNTKSRFLFGDLSNSATSDYVSADSSAFFSSSLSFNSPTKNDSLGMFSECEESTPKKGVKSVKRNLSKTFMLSSEVQIFSSNKQVEAPKIKKFSRRSSLVPVIPLEPSKFTNKDLIEPSSPPRPEQHSICSIQSKKNLKRLMR